MFQRPVSRRKFVTGMLVVGVGTTGGIAREVGKEAALPLVDSSRLGGDDRYLTFVSTDKPIYRGGETLYVRGAVLHHSTHAPLKQPGVGSIVEIIGPKGDQAASGRTQVEDGVLAFAWQVPDGQAGGEYVVKVTFPGYGHVPAERKFDVRAYRAPRLKTQVKFFRDGYGPGDEAAASLHVERAEGGPPDGATVTAVARVDGDEAFRGPVSIDAAGDCVVRFKLPGKIIRGEGTLSMIIEDGGVVETAAKTIPILLQTVDVGVYPEGGELVAGLPNRVYFEAFTPAKKPADLAGAVLDDRGRRVADFRSVHEGRGRFEFTPETGRRYELKIDEPAGIATRIPLSEVKTAGAVIRSAGDTFARRKSIELTVSVTGDLGSPTGSTHEVIVTIAKREAVLGRKTVSGRGPQTVEFDLPDSVDGVLTATVWTGDGKPLAERLIFREPARTLRVELTADARQYSPGDRVKVRVKTSDDTGSPASAVVGLTVTDDGVLEMIERREQSPRLPVMVFLENEVRELADAHVYLDPQNKQAALAVDLLLGTQGWRRFAQVEWEKFIGTHGDRGKRALAIRLPPFTVVNRPTSIRIDVGAVNVFTQSGAALAAAVPEGTLGEGLKSAEDRSEAVRLGQIEGKNSAAENAERQEEIVQRLEKKIEPARKLVAGPIRDDFVYVRVYAHELRPDRKPGDRFDFTETLFWHAGLKTDDRGEAQIEFALNDSVSTFRVFADAFDSAGALGGATELLESVQPFYLEPKLPLEVTQGDRVLLPVTCVNATSAALGVVSMTIDAPFADNKPAPDRTIGLAAGARERALVELSIGPHNGSFETVIAASAGPYVDRVTRKIAVRPRGFPIEAAGGGLLEPGGAVRQEIVIPDDLVAGSFQSRIEVYPTPLANLTQALESLIQEPCGCFEQTSSTVYPLVMAQQYFMSHQGVPAALVARSTEILSRGYDRLRGFECKSGGYEWFGSDPGHDALTAYGLMEFTDVSRVMPVDRAMLERTRKWLLDQRDGNGSFARKTHTLHTWLAEPEVATSYNVWALLSAGLADNLEKEIAWVAGAARETANTYVAALAANVLLLAGDKASGDKATAATLLDKLAGKQIDNGSLKDATVSVVGSGGEALSIETTALAVLAWLKNPAFTANVERGIRYLAEQCKGGRFGSTQSTVLALKAIVAYDEARARPKAAGRLQLVVDDKPLGEPVAFNEKTEGAITLSKLPELSAGKHTIEVRMTDGSEMPASIYARYWRLKPDTSPDCKLHLEVTLRDAKLTEGSVTEAHVMIENRTSETVPTPMAVIGLPGGLEVRHDQLKELVKADTIAAYEVLGREVVLYWRALRGEERVTLPLSLVASVPGAYTAPASRAYLYYTNEHKHWVERLQVTIEASA